MNERTPVLAFRRCVVPVRFDGIDRLELDAVLEPGALWLVESETEAQEQAFVDAASGRARLANGTVRFAGHDWAHLPSRFREALQGRIGLLPRRGLFLPYADMAQNTLLAARYHRREPDAELIATADALARRFGMPGLPAGPAMSEGSLDALLAACVRAFLGAPLLVLVEGRPQPWRADLVQPLVDAMQEVREAGGSVIWFLQDDSLFDDPAVPATRRYRLRGRTLRGTDS